MLYLIETFIEGHNPEAAGALRGHEVEALRRCLDAGESLEAFVRGLASGTGPVLWALSTRRVLVIDTRRGRLLRSAALADIASLEAEAGRYGATLALRDGSRRVAMIAADALLGDAFVAALVRQAPALAAPAPLVGAAPFTPQAREVQGWFAEARAQLRPSSPVAAAQVVVALSEAAALRERGVINDAEFGTLKDRLLAA